MKDQKKISRRDLLRLGVGAAALTALGIAATTEEENLKKNTVWQLDPEKCVQCGKCETTCVMHPSAVKCVHAYALCGYCELCGGYFPEDVNLLDTSAENQICPTAAILRTHIEDPYYEYTIIEELCIACARCVEGCTVYGNGSLFLQVRHDRCLNCNDCAIARACPANAFMRVPVDKPYILKGEI